MQGGGPHGDIFLFDEIELILLWKLIVSEKDREAGVYIWKLMCEFN